MDEVIKYFEDLGLKEFIEDKEGNSIYSDTNLKTAKQIVEGYFEGQDIDDEAKKAILKCILGSAHLKKNGMGNGVRLIPLQRMLSKTGLSEKEIYGMMINLAVNNSISEQSGYGYGALLSHSKYDISQELRINYDAAIKAGLVPTTIVTKSTIAKAKSETMSDNEVFELQQYFEKLGLTEFIKDRNGELIYPDKNLYMARYIVEGYFKDSDDIDADVCRNKKAVLQCLLKNTCLQKKRNVY